MRRRLKKWRTRQGLKKDYQIRKKRDERSLERKTNRELEKKKTEEDCLWFAGRDDVRLARLAVISNFRFSYFLLGLRKFISSKVSVQCCVKGNIGYR